MDIRVIFILAALGIVQCKLISSCGDIKAFVKGHNAKRLMLAEGTVSGQPAASKMTYLIWDDEIAAKASQWAAGNKYGHNPNRTLPSKRFDVGENIFFYGTSDMKFKLDPQQAVDAWWSEYKDFTYHPLSVKDFSGPKQIGHYTQMAWADSIRLGCGISNYQDKTWNNFLVVCNYGPVGNFLGQTPYKSDNGASRHLVCGESDCSHMYGTKC